jgi:hypothetical protein
MESATHRKEGNMTKKSESRAIRKTSVAWPPFTEVLTRVLDTLAEDQYLIISAKNSNHFVQFAAQGSYGMRVETTSNEYLNKTEKLDRKQLAALVKTGWCKPTGNAKQATPELDPDGSPNYFAEFPVPVPAGEVSRLAITTLTDILRVPHPSMLEYEAFDGQGQPIALLELGLKPAQRDKQTYRPEDSPNIAMNLLETIRTVSGNDDLDFDSDGDVGIRYGSIIAFARVIGEPPMVHLFSPVVTGVTESPEVFERLNEINGHTQIMRFYWRDGTIYAVADVPAAPFVSAHIADVFKAFCRVADDMDDLLQSEFGGRTTFDEWIPSIARH